MVSSTKERVLRTDVLPRNHVQVRNSDGVVTQEEHTALTIFSRQRTTSEGHNWPKGRGVRDEGGPFSTWKTVYTRDPSGHAEYKKKDLYYTDVWDGDYIPYVGSSPSIFTKTSFPLDSEVLAYARGGLPSSNLTTLGTKFISQTIPTSPVVDGSVALAELFREGLPSMIGSAFLKNRASFFKNLGSEYLNVEFGWKPLVSDLKNASKAIIETERILKTLEANSGRELSRKRLLPTETLMNQIQDTGTISPSGIGFHWSSPPRYMTSDHTVRKQWFSGCYLYHFEPARMNELSRIVAEARLLYGLELTPETLWNLAPWSWLVDWFANVGPILSNVSAFQSDNLVLKYGYVMENVTRTYARTNWMGVVNPSTTVYVNHPARVYDKFFVETKTRVKATPYGFGLNTTAFTDRQWTILGALGLTRGPKAL